MSAFSTEYDINSQTWQNSNKVDVDKKILGRPGTIYFNNKINVHSCDERDEGCNSFYLAEFFNDENNDSKYSYNYDVEIYLKKLQIIMDVMIKIFLQLRLIILRPKQN